MTTLHYVFTAFSPSTTGSALLESARRSLAPVPETRGPPVIVLAPVAVAAAPPAQFMDVEQLVEEAEKDPLCHDAITAGRQDVAEHYFSGEPRSLTWYRRNNGWSQKELATRMGTSQSYIARLEAGAIDPQVSTLMRLAAVLEVTPSALLEALGAQEGRR